MSMEEFEQLVPDADLFERVWKRVMPDEEKSIVEVNRQKPLQMHQHQHKPDIPAREHGEREDLQQLLTEMDEGLGQGNVIVRRVSGTWPLRSSLGRSAARLQTAWFLLTGEHWRGRPRQSVWSGGRQMLRRQYIWELRFSQLCRQIAEHTRSEELRELLPALEEQSRSRREMIRELLSRG